MDGKIDCNLERIERRARTNRGSKIINVGVSLLAAKMNFDTIFSMEKNLIDISFFTVTACVGSRIV